MKPDKKFIEQLAYRFEYLPDKIKNIRLPCTSLDVANELMLVVIDKILGAIQCSDLQLKKEMKFKFLGNIEEMVGTMKKHRKDLHMEDDD